MKSRNEVVTILAQEAATHVAEMQGMSDEEMFAHIKQLVDAAEIAFAVWPDADQPGASIPWPLRACPS